jgi:alpha-glucosidase
LGDKTGPLDLTRRRLRCAIRSASIPSAAIPCIKPCLLDDHPLCGEVAVAGGFIAGGDDQAPLKSQFWDGEGAHVDFTNPAGLAWWKEGLTRQVLDCGVDAGWNDNNE